MQISPFLSLITFLQELLRSESIMESHPLPYKGELLLSGHNIHNFNAEGLSNIIENELLMTMRSQMLTVSDFCIGDGITSISGNERTYFMHHQVTFRNWKYGPVMWHFLIFPKNNAFRFKIRH